MTGTSKRQVSRLCEEIDERVRAFLNPPLEGDWPFLRLDATHVKLREGGRVVSTAVTVAVAVDDTGAMLPYVASASAATSITTIYV